jgi:hypothetical protein
MSVYQFASPNYDKLVEKWEVEENISIDVVEKTQEDYL